MRILKYSLLAVIVLVMLFFAVGLFKSQSSFEIRLPVESSQEAVAQHFARPQHLATLFAASPQLEVIKTGQWRLTVMDSDADAILLSILSSDTQQLGYQIENQRMSIQGQLRFNALDENQTEIVSRQTLEGHSLFWRSVLTLARDTLATKHKADLLQTSRLIKRDANHQSKDAQTEHQDDPKDLKPDVSG